MSRRLAFPAVLFAAAAAVAATACSVSTEPAGTTADEVVGGRPSTVSAVVLVADAADTYACVGALVRDDLVAVPAECAPSAKAIYVGYDVDVPNGEALAPKAGSAQHVRFGAVQYVPKVRSCAAGHYEELALLVLERPLVGVAPLAVAGAEPGVGGSCVVAGPGAEVYGQPRGRQRMATVQVTAVAPLQCRVDAKGVDGSVAVGDFGAVLLCGGDFAGLKRRTVRQNTPTTENEVAYTTFTSPEARTALEAAILSAGRPPAGGPEPVPGQACARENEILSGACGLCGTRQAVCLADASGARTWSLFGACQNEGTCTPGDSQTSTAGCLPGTQRTRTCQSTCEWANYGACL